jgi:hypothetical protein
MVRRSVFAFVLGLATLMALGTYFFGVSTVVQSAVFIGLTLLFLALSVAVNNLRRLFVLLLVTGSFLTWSLLSGLFGLAHLYGFMVVVSVFVLLGTADRVKT